MTTEHAQPTSRSALYGYAVLRANFDHNAASYLDNFDAFVLDVLANKYPGPQTEASIGNAVRECFGIAMPDGVVAKLLKRLVAAGKVQQVEQASFRINEAVRSGLVSLQASMAEFLVQQGELAAKFEAFVQAHHPESADLVSDASEALQSFIDRYAAPLLRRGVTGQTDLSTHWGELQGVEYIVGSFVLHLEATDAAAFGYLIDAVKGAILTGVLEIGPGDLRHKLDGLTIILDTPVVLSCLGYQGAIPQRATGQLLELARALDVRVVCYEHTEKELNGVLDAVITHLRGRPSDVVRGMDIHFREIGATASDVAVEQAHLRENLQRIGIRVIGRPDEYYKFGLDESALEDDLRKTLPTQKDATRFYDLQSLSATHRLRRGSSPKSLERCAFLFVTDNYGLVQVARRIHERHLWPLAMLQSELAALLWVRSPAIADDLPRQQLLAAVYTGMQPPGHLWMKYVEEIEKLEARGVVNSDEAIVLRSQAQARDALMDVTLGEADKVSPKAVETVVSRLRDQLSSPFQAAAAEAAARAVVLTAAHESAAHEAEQMRAQRVELDGQLSNLRGMVTELVGQNADREQHIADSASIHARRIARACLMTIAIVFVGPALIKTFFPEWLRHLPTWIGWAGFVAGLFVFVFSAFVMFVGGTVRDRFAPVELWIAGHIERRWRERLGLPVDKAR